MQILCLYCFTYLHFICSKSYSFNFSYIIHVVLLIVKFYVHSAYSYDTLDQVLSGQRYDLVVDEDGEVDLEDWYMRDIPVAPPLNILKWTRVGRIIPNQQEGPVQIRNHVSAVVQQCFADFIDGKGITFTSTICLAMFHIFIVVRATNLL